VGKSSLLNALVGRRIAKVSATPGKTRMLNVFRVPPSLYLLDLPGYGYARASQTERAKFRALIRRTLDRPRLAGVVWLLDIRRDPSAEDRAIHKVFVGAGTPVLAALTKGDTLSRGRRVERSRGLGAAVDLPADQVIVTSARTRDGVPELRDAIAALVSALAA
jgi:GTP-binding protein